MALDFGSALWSLTPSPWEIIELRVDSGLCSAMLYPGYSFTSLLGRAFVATCSQGRKGHCHEGSTENQDIQGLPVSIPGK
jgi:hypothetical protein